MNALLVWIICALISLLVQGTEVNAARIGGGGSGGSSSTSLNGAFLNGKEITGANSLANAVRIGDGLTPICIYTDSTNVPRIRPCTASDVRTYIETGFTWGLFDVNGDTDMYVVTPGAASTRLMLEYMSGYRPRGYFFVSAGAFNGDGTNCPASSSAVTINSGPKVQTMICGSGANGDMDFDVVMPMDWDGGTLIFEASYTQTAANTSAMNSDIKAQCRGAGETPSSTWGTAIAIDDAAVTGSSAEDKTASAAVTPAGTCAAGDHLFVRYTLDVTGTTTPEATLNFYGVGVYYSKQYWGN